MAKGETVKYIIDADTSGFSRGMTQAAVASDVASRQIDRNLTKTSKSTENNFKDIRRNASTAASSIRNFGVALQGLNTTSLIIGVSVLAGAFIELAAALSSAAATATILVPLFTQGAAAAGVMLTAVTGLGDAFGALQANDLEAWTEALATMSPAAQSVAKSAGTIYRVFKSIQINTQEALWAGFGETMLKLGAEILPVVNNGMQIVGRSMNRALNDAANLASTPLFRGLVATIFNDTAHNIDILRGALEPVLSIFTNLYAVTRPYVTLLAQSFVNLMNNTAAYLSTAKGQAALNSAIQNGIVALQQIGAFIGSVYTLLTSLFRTAIASGAALIPTLTGIIEQMTAWVNSGEGQRELIALFQFTSLVVQSVANALGIALGFFLNVITAVTSLNPGVQALIVNFLAITLVMRPLLSYFAQLYLAIRVIGATLFNLVQQAIVVFTALGAASSIILVLAVGLIALGAVIRGPLGGALIVIGTAIAAYIGLTFLAARASQAAATSFYAQGTAALMAQGAETSLAGTNILLGSTMYHVAAAAASSGVGMSFAARAATFLHTAMIGLLVAAAGLVVILSMLGVFGSSTKKAQGATSGFGSSLSALQKTMKGVGGTGNAVSNNGLAALNTSLADTTGAADKASASLAGFDKMNVLTEDKGSAGISGLPALPGVGNPSLGAPTLDTGAFDKAIADMQKEFDGIQADLAKPLPNPFVAIGEWINKHPWIGLAVFGTILAVITALFVAFGFAAIAAAIGVAATIGLIVLAVVAVIAIIIILVKNWDTVWAAIKAGASATWQFLQGVWDAIVRGIVVTVAAIIIAFQGAWDGIKAAWAGVVDFFIGIWEGIQFALAFYVALWKSLFIMAWDGVVAVWGMAVGFFRNVWNGIAGIFSGVGPFFGNMFSGAWSAIVNAFAGIPGFFQGVWNTIVGIFGSVGSAIGNAVGNAFRSVINSAINFVTDFINNTIRLINAAAGVINKIPGVNIRTISTITLPKLARGGIIDSPMVAQLGEAGQEAVMPLENNTQWIDKLAAKINSANGGSGQPLNLTVQIGEDKVASKIIDLINEKTQMSGRNTILV